MYLEVGLTHIVFVAAVTSRLTGGAVGEAVLTTHRMELVRQAVTTVQTSTVSRAANTNDNTCEKLTLTKRRCTCTERKEKYTYRLKKLWGRGIRLYRKVIPARTALEI